MNQPSRLEQQIQFIIELDKLKQIFRRTRVCDRSRCENDAEHSWHITVLAFLLCEHANDSTLDLLKTMKMLLIHDVVEIDAGDIFFYHITNHHEKRQREQLAAERIFGLLPLDQANELKALWEEFENQQTNESQFATALDRFQPILQNFYSEGASWREHGITKQQVLSLNSHIAKGSKLLWKFVQNLVDQAVERGMLIDSPA